MKIIFVSLIMLIIYGCTEKQPKIQALDLNSENLELLALNSHSKETINKFVLNQIKTKFPKEYYPIIKDKEKVVQLIEKHTNIIMTKAAKVAENTNFRIAKTVRYFNFDEESSELSLNNFISGKVYTYSTQKLKDDGMPSHYSLLIPNAGIINTFKVDTKKFKSKAQNRTKSLFIEIIVNLPKHQNLNNFQTVIKQVNLYESSQKNILLASKKENINTNDLIDHWLLSDGYTSKLIGIHAYSFYGFRLQDPIKITTRTQEFCNKTQKLGIHQVIVCNRPVGENMYLIITYIGGALSKLDLVAKSALSRVDVKRVKQEITTRLKLSKNIFNKKQSFWNRHRSEFKLFTDALNGIENPELKYEYAFGTHPDFKDLDLTLIISIISHESKKLIEEHK